MGAALLSFPFLGPDVMASVLLQAFPGFQLLPFCGDEELGFRAPMIP